ncbi:MAG: LuxR C-terminal-related transcriptional regulator [Tepidisphaeraceae bacterium]
MAQRSVADVLQESLRELYAHLDLDALPLIAIGVAQRLVDCDVTAYNEIDPTRGRAVGIVMPEVAGPPIFAALPIWERYIHQHPLISHFRANPYDRPHKVTDFISQAAFEDTDIYREFFGPLNLRYQIVTNLPTRSTMVAGISQNREKRDFTERDRRALDLLRPHLLQAYENAALVSELRANSTRLELLMDRLDRGQIVIAADGRVVLASPAAVRFVQEFLPDETLAASALPQTLAAWSRKQITALEQQSSEPEQPVPLLIGGPDGRLAVRLIRDEQPRRFVIVLSRAARIASAETLMTMGLTAREAEVLYWCVEGKSRAETAVILDISERTVQKHLEHVYGKLDVTNRVAAVTKALEWARW